MANTYLALDMIDICRAYIARRVLRDFPCDGDEFTEADVMMFITRVIEHMDYRVIQRLASVARLHHPMRDEIYMIMTLIF